MESLTEDECENILVELLEKGSYAHSLGVRLVEIERMPDSPNVKFANCSGLEAYLAVCEVHYVFLSTVIVVCC
jgi:hypothetical protein